MVAPPARLKIRVAGWQGIRSIAGPARTTTVRRRREEEAEGKKKRLD